jgi:hypothetical protein
MRLVPRLILPLFRNHLRDKHPDAYKDHPHAKKKKIEEAGKRVNEFDSGLADILLARAVGGSTISLRQGSSIGLSDFCRYLNPAYQLPGRDKLTKLVIDEAGRTKSLIKRLLKSVIIVSFMLYFRYLLNSRFLGPHSHRHMDTEELPPLVCYFRCEHLFR